MVRVFNPADALPVRIEDRRGWLVDQAGRCWRSRAASSCGPAASPPWSSPTADQPSAGYPGTAVAPRPCRSPPGHGRHHVRERGGAGRSEERRGPRWRQAGPGRRGAPHGGGVEGGAAPVAHAHHGGPRPAPGSRRRPGPPRLCRALVGGQACGHHVRRQPPEAPAAGEGRQQVDPRRPAPPTPCWPARSRGPGCRPGRSARCPGTGRRGPAPRSVPGQHGRHPVEVAGQVRPGDAQPGGLLREGGSAAASRFGHHGS